ncbi:hypothetical protein, conserved [Trypanosoma brucei gambiense DAL972]|uniref:Uncharacterized protein n=1 Tax=Trypanosoma brucei gambiense (strain MHOM/CI/86/DAL972) TaxID=679716 RepID=D0A1M3_TRYB9|nr:hypothetical protein, conserved [Trypanosoma brucei gambiense DAL972]CBH15165.1 hypothetical protein, conserved [Trypanosoma brucei gambiense DAL972]|eukprot:XP_011777431.1 hypothetical protein, conserved [Trypanosoma brucei gambiense DAL972]
MFRGSGARKCCSSSFLYRTAPTSAATGTSPPSLVTVPLLRAALLLRWRLLSLQFDGDSNMCVLAEDAADGLPRGTRLEMYGSNVQLVRQLSGAGEALPQPSVIGEVTATLEGALTDDTTERRGRQIVAVLSPPHLSSSLGGPEFKGNEDVEVIAQWTLSRKRVENVQRVTDTTKGDGVKNEEPPPLMENGIVFPSPRFAGLRVLRAARHSFALLLENELRERTGESEVGKVGPLAVLDVSELDCTFSRVAVQMAVERGLVLEQHMHVNFVPLTPAATATADETVRSFLRLVAHPTRGAHLDPLRPLQARCFKLGCCTFCSKGRGSAANEGSKKDEASLVSRLAGVISKIHSNGTLLVNLVGDGINHEELRQGAEMHLVEALLRADRCGMVIDEVLPAADTRGTAISFVVSLC